MMVGLLLWKQRETREKAVTLDEVTVLRMRLWCAKIAREDREAEALLRWRVARVLRKMHRQGITRVVLPEKFPYGTLLEKQGLRPVSTLPLRRRLAADWVSMELTERELPVGSAQIAVAADQLTSEVVRTVVELVLRHRYVLLDIPHGGEELCRQLRREYGATLLLSPARERLETAEAAVLFAPRSWREHPVSLRLYEECQPLPRLLLPPVLERQLPAGADRAQLLSALIESGALKPGQITLTGNRGK